MEIDNKIRDRIEALLVNDAKNYSEIKKMATADEPLEAEVLADDQSIGRRDRYHRRRGVAEKVVILGAASERRVNDQVCGGREVIATGQRQLMKLVARCAAHSVGIWKGPRSAWHDRPVLPGHAIDVVLEEGPVVAHLQETAIAGEMKSEVHLVSALVNYVGNYCGNVRCICGGVRFLPRGRAHRLEAVLVLVAEAGLEFPVLIQ